MNKSSLILHIRKKDMLPFYLLSTIILTPVLAALTELRKIDHYFPNRTVRDNNCKPIMTGTSNYYWLITGGQYIIDNTGLIEFVLSGTHVVTLPRRMGKSTTADMLKSFLGIEINENGNTIPLEKSENHNLFENGKMTLKNLGEEIEIPGGFVVNRSSRAMERLGKYVVIFLSFTSPPKITLFNDVLRCVERRLRDCYADHAYLEPLYPIEFKFLRDIADIPCLLTISESIASLLYKLANNLHEFHQREVYLIVDEFDSMLNKVYLESPLSVEKKNDIVDFFTQLYGLTQNHSTHLAGAFFTGTSPWKGGSDIFSQISNVVFHDLLSTDDPIISYFGVHGQHVETLLREFHLQHFNRSVYKKYDGYYFGEQQPTKFNVYAIAMFFGSKQVRNFWTEATADDAAIVRKFFRSAYFRHTFLALMLGSEKIRLCIENLQLSETDYQTLSEMLFEMDELYLHRDRFAQLAFAYLYHIGYVTRKYPRNDKTVASSITLKIPNEEINETLWNEYFHFITGRPAKNLLQNDYMRSGAFASFATLIADYARFIKSNDTNGTNIEIQYSNFLKTSFPFPNLNDDRKIYGDEHFVQDFLNVAGRLYDLEPKMFDMEYPSDNTNNDGVTRIFYHFGTKLVVVQLTYDDTLIDTALNRTVKYANLFFNDSKYNNVVAMKLIGITVLKDTRVTVQSRMMSRDDVSVKSF